MNYACYATANANTNVYLTEEAMALDGPHLTNTNERQIGSSTRNVIRHHSSQSRAGFDFCHGQ